MGCSTAVGIDNDFASCQTTVALWATDDKASCWIDEKFNVAFNEVGGDDGLDDFFNYRFAQICQFDFGVVLGGQYDRIDRNWQTIFIADGHLRFGIGAQPRQTTIAAQIGLTLDQAMRQMNR